MIIAKCFFETDLELPAIPTRGIYYGSPVSPNLAQKFNPYFFCAIPVQRRLTPILTCFPRPHGAYWQGDLFNFSSSPVLGEADVAEWGEVVASGSVPQFAIRQGDAEPWIEKLLKLVNGYFLAFTSRDDAAELWERFRIASVPEKDRMVMRRAKQALRHFRENLFVCVRWQEWTRQSGEAGFKEFETDCERHGIRLSADTIKVRARRLGLPPMREYRRTLERKAVA